MHPDSLPMPEAINDFRIVVDRIPGWPERKDRKQTDESRSFAEANLFPLTIVPKAQVIDGSASQSGSSSHENKTAEAAPT